jgi:small subunit ribosomal protein S17
MNDMPESPEATPTEATEATESTETAETKPAKAAKDVESTELTNGVEPTGRAPRKVREGVVVTSGMDKTVVVAVIERVRHPRYNKFVNRTKKLYVHDETNDANAGDRVRVMETRPLSKTKRWRIMEVLERAK